MKKIYFFFPGLILLLSFNISAQEEHEIPIGIPHHYSTDDGLSHSGVMCILQDHIGFMWFGTWDGLNKFDGYKFTTYKSRPGDTQSLTHNRIDDIAEDKYGYLWLKTYDENIHRFDRKKEVFQTVAEIIPLARRGSTLTKIVSTQKGNIWLITQNSGCFRVITDTTNFGFSVQKYDEKQDSLHKLPGNTVNEIVEDNNGNTWILTHNGLACVSNKNFSNFLLDIKNKVVSGILEQKQLNRIWFSTADGIIYNLSLEEGSFTKFQLPEKPNITCLDKISSESLVFGTSKGEIIEWNLSKNYQRKIDLRTVCGENTQVLSFYRDSYGLLWVETNKPGVIKCDPVAFSVKRFIQKTDKVSSFVYYGDYFKVFEDKNNFLWINLKGGGFCYYNRKKDDIGYFFNEPGKPNRKFSNLVTYAMSDLSGNLWLSTHSRGIEKICFINEKFRFYQPFEGSEVLSANEIRAIYEDIWGRLWVSTKEGKLCCYSYDRKKVKIFNYESIKPGEIAFNGMVYCITQDSDGVIWLGTKGDGIVSVTNLGNPENMVFKTSHYTHDSKNRNSISNNWVYSIFEDSKKRIWVGTYGGGLNLLIKSGLIYNFLNYENGLKNYPHIICDKVRYIQEDTIGNIWLGTTNGLIVFDPDSDTPENFNFSVYQKIPGDAFSLANNDVHYILRSRTGNMWVSTFGGGIGRVLLNGNSKNKYRFKMYTTENGLPIDIVLSMLEDNEGYLWLATENGLSKFNTQTEEFVNFAELDGIKKLIFSEAACFKNTKGEMYFGSVDGYYAFNPRHIKKENRSPKIMFVNFQLFNRDVGLNTKNSPLHQSINSTQAIKLKYNQSVFSIEYAGLDFRYSEKLEYAFMLEGFETSWNYVRHQRKATYTNLPAGKYIFKVMCSSTGVFDNAEYQSLKIEILPPWWKTIWAYLAYFVVLLLIVIFTRRIVLEIIGLRNKVIIEQKLSELKLRFYTNISHELRTPLTLILGPTEDLLAKEKLNENTRYFLQIIDKNARRMLRHINQLLDFRKMETGNMKLKVSEIEIISFLRDIYSGFAELAKSKNINFQFNTNAVKQIVWADMDKLDTLFFNLLSNAFKFTPENKSIKLSVEVIENSGKVNITVIDEGIGISREDLPLIFNRFAISNQSAGKNIKGTGIGLSLVKEIITMHKGDISVASTEGEGSIFTVTILLGKDHFQTTDLISKRKKHNDLSYSVNEEMLNEVSENPTHATDVTENLPVLLIVEDNNDLRQYISHCLQKNYKILEAVNGLEGFEKALEHIPDLVISDIMMPKSDGIELLNNMRSEFKTSHIPVILLTAKSGTDNIIQGIRYGADAYITKPFSMELLQARVGALIEQRQKLMERYTNQYKVLELAPDEVVVTARDEQFLKDIIKIIENNISDPDFNVEKIAQAVNLGRTTFFKKVKSLTGFAPVEFMREIKLKRGMQLLESGEFTVSEIAFNLGFSDAGYFTKCFKEKYNIIPTEILKQARKK